MKAIAAALLLTSALWTAAAAPASALAGTREVSIEWNGAPVQGSGASYITGGVTFVSIEMISKLKGISVSWMPDEGLARLWVDRGGVFGFKPGTAYADDLDKRYPLGAVIGKKDGKAMLPLRFIAEMAGADVSWDPSSGVVKVDQKRTAIASVPGSRSRLYAMSSKDNEYRGITLEWKGMRKSFPSWVNPSGIGSPPQLKIADVGGGEADEAVILLNAGSGTGVYLEEAHVVDGRTYREIPVEDPLSFVRQRVVSQVEHGSAGTVIRVTAGGKTAEKTMAETGEEASAADLPSGLTFGSIIRYDASGGALTVTLAGSYGISDFAGEAKVIYGMSAGKLTPRSVLFAFYE